MPVKIRSTSHFYSINYYFGTSRSTLSKFDFKEIFSKQSAWAGSNTGSVLADSENYISTYVQDCAYVNEIVLATEFDDAPTNAPFKQLFKEVVNNTDISYEDNRQVTTRFFRDGFLGISDDLSSPPTCKIRNDSELSGKDLHVYMRSINSTFLSPVEARLVMKDKYDVPTNIVIPSDPFDLLTRLKKSTDPNDFRYSA